MIGIVLLVILLCSYYKLYDIVNFLTIKLNKKGLDFRNAYLYSITATIVTIIAICFSIIEFYN